MIICSCGIPENASKYITWLKFLPTCSYLELIFVVSGRWHFSDSLLLRLALVASSPVSPPLVVTSSSFLSRSASFRPSSPCSTSASTPAPSSARSSLPSSGKGHLKHFKSPILIIYLQGGRGMFRGHNLLLPGLRGPGGPDGGGHGDHHCGEAALQDEPAPG